jgi:hypothetical protein
MKKLFTLCAVCGMTILSAQHHSSGTESDSMLMSTPMSHSFSLSLPMTRNASGTAWLPDSTVMYGHGVMTEKWMFMFHANVFLRYNRQDLTNESNRGGEKFDAPNWFMGMGQRKTGKNGLFRFSAMLSLDPLTVGAEGYPLLYQSGETYNGQPLVDRQHPHDLFSELSVGYTHRVSGNSDVFVYLAYPGEPALGPVAFMHRLSALNNPDAPLGHHWQDATHITYGVATVGFRVNKIKIDASLFTGREPDENRYNFDRPRFDSYSLRVSYNPVAQLALQVSQALLISPEQKDAEENIARTTASAIHHYPFAGRNRYLATSLIWGYNNGEHEEHSILLEPNLQLDRTAIYGRYEWVQKSAEELNLAEVNPFTVFNIQALTLGVSHVILRKFGSNLAIGAQGTLFAAPSLEPVYGKNPVSAEIYLRFYPDLMHMHHHE